ncbi:MAG: glycosyltransferase [Pyrinomonadaceae bacterium]
MRLLVISFAFPPFNSIGAVRVAKTAKYLSRFGHDIRVLTASEQPFRQTLPVELPSEQIIYSKWFTLRRSPPNQRIAESKPAINGHANSQSGGRLLPALKNAVGYSFKNLFDFPDSNIGWLPYAVAEGSRLWETWKPDLILASSPPPTSLLVAYRLSKKFRVPWVADLRDLWMDHSYYDPPRWRKLMEGKLERRVLTSAAGIVTVSEPLAGVLKRKYGVDAAVVLNGFDQADYPEHSRSPSSDGIVRILYTGMIYPGKRDPSPLLEALALLGPRVEKVRVIFHGSFLESVKPLIARFGVQHLVEVNEPVSYKESLRMQTEADVLLLLLGSGPTELGVYTGKLFEYIGARRPILAIGNVDSAAAKLIQQRRVGLVVNDPAQIAAELKRLIAQKQETGSVPGLTADVTKGISREEQTKILEGYLLEVMASGTSNEPINVG